MVDRCIECGLLAPNHRGGCDVTEAPEEKIVEEEVLEEEVEEEAVSCGECGEDPCACEAEEAEDDAEDDEDDAEDDE